MKRLLKNFLETRYPAVGVFYRKLRDEYIYATLKPYDSELGFKIYGDFSRHFTESDAVAYRIHNQEIALFLERLETADVFIDIGANIGIFTMLAASKGKPVVAIEAHPRNYQNLLRNLDENKLSGVECFNVALSDAVGCAKLFGSGEMASLTESWGGHATMHSLLVACTTLDRLIGDRFAGQRLLIKMDVEGHEFQVLQGATQVLEKSPAPLWLFEHHYSENFEGVNPHYLDVLERFWAAGYSLTSEETEQTLEPAQAREQVAQGANPCPDGLNFIAARA